MDPLEAQARATIAAALTEGRSRSRPCRPRMNARRMPLECDFANSRTTSTGFSARGGGVMRPVERRGTPSSGRIVTLVLGQGTASSGEHSQSVLPSKRPVRGDVVRRPGRREPRDVRTARGRHQRSAGAPGGTFPSGEVSGMTPRSVGYRSAGLRYRGRGAARAPTPSRS